VFQVTNRPNKWHSLRQWTAWQWSVLLRSQFIIALTYIRLHKHGFRKALDQARATIETASGLSPDKELEMAQQAAYALDVAIKYGPSKPRCLVRSLALAWFLKRRSLPFELRVGVERGRSMENRAGFSAHAWVETQGVVLNGDSADISNFRPFNLGV